MNLQIAVQLAKEGKQEGFRFLYEATSGKNYAVALHYVRDEELAKDVLQEAYSKAFSSLDQLQDANKFAAWMSRIVTTKALDELRKRKELSFSQMTDEQNQEIPVEEALEDRRMEAQPELVLDRQETVRLVREMIDTLSDEQRVCILMFYMQGMSVAEIAQTLGVGENTVKSRLYYGRSRIKEKVLELEKKGTKLYTVSPFAGFLYLLFANAEQTQAAILPLERLLPQEPPRPQEMPDPQEEYDPQNGGWAGDGGSFVSGAAPTARAAGLSVFQKALIAVIAVEVIGFAGIGGIYMIDKNAVALPSWESLLPWGGGEAEDATESAAYSAGKEASSDDGSDEEEAEEDVNMGFVSPGETVEDDGVIYYAYEGSGLRMGLMCFDEETGETYEVYPQTIDGNDTDGFHYLSVRGNYIYAMWNQENGSSGYLPYIYRIAKDGSSAEQLAMGDNPVIAGDKIYYRGAEWETDGLAESAARSDGYIYCMNLDGSDQEQLFYDDEATIYRYQNEPIFGSYDENGQIYYDLEQNRLDSDEIETHIPLDADDNFTIQTSYIYYEYSDRQFFINDILGGGDAFVAEPVWVLRDMFDYVFLKYSDAEMSEGYVVAVRIKDGTVYTLANWYLAE